MAKLTLTDIASGYNSYSTYNANNTLIEAALENTLSLDGTSPNAMAADLDMNSFNINNLPDATQNQQPVTLAQAASIAGVTNPLTKETVSAVLYPTTTAETAAAVTPVDFTYPELHLLRYGTNTNPGTTDMTTAITNALAVASQIGGALVKLPAETVAHTGDIAVPASTGFEGESRLTSVLFLLASSDPVNCFSVDGADVTFRRCTVDGNRDNNTTGNGISCGTTANECHFLLLDDVEIKRCDGIGLYLKQSNLSSIRQVIIQRCNTGAQVERCVNAAFFNVSIGKFVTQGLLLQGTATSKLTFSWYGGQMEATADGPLTADAPFVKIDAIRSDDTISINDMFWYGHYVDTGVQSTGVLLNNPIYADKIKFHNINFRDFKTAVTFTGVAAGEIREVDMSTCIFSDNTTAPTGELGLRLDTSYDFDFITDIIDLTTTGVRYVYPVAQSGPCRIWEIQEMVTTTYSSATPGVLDIGHDVSGGRWVNDLALADTTAAGTITDLTLSNSAHGTTDWDHFRVNVVTALVTAGAARYRIRGTIY